MPGVKGVKPGADCRREPMKLLIVHEGYGIYTDPFSYITARLNKKGQPIEKSYNFYVSFSGALNALFQKVYKDKLTESAPYKDFSTMVGIVEEVRMGMLPLLELNPQAHV